MQKLELLATAKHVEELYKILDAGADAVKIGHQKYGLRLPGDFELDDIRKATTYAHTKNKKVYVALNGIFHNHIFNSLSKYLSNLQEIGVDCIICGDPSIFVIVKEHDIQIPVHWNPETLATNYQTLEYWMTKGATRAVLSNELQIENVVEMKKKLPIQIEVQAHGMTCIFQSKRELVSNYYKHVSNGEEDKNTSQAGKLYIKEFDKPNTHYPIFEDFSGTHIMSDADMCMVEFLDLLIEAKVDSLRLEGILKSSDYQVEIVKIYREAIDLYYENPESYKLAKEEFKRRIQELQPADRKLDTGFYFKEQIY
jgi:U32 family peptidase